MSVKPWAKKVQALLWRASDKRVCKWIASAMLSFIESITAAFSDVKFPEDSAVSVKT